MLSRVVVASVLSFLMTVDVRSATAEDAFEVAKQQVKELAPVLGAIRACDSGKADNVYLEFMRAKRARGLDQQQAAFLGTYVGAMEGLMKPESSSCFAADDTARDAEIARLRETW